MSRKTLFIVNPESRAGETSRLWNQRAKNLLEQGLELEARFTKAPLQAIELTRTALSEGYDHIVAVGGDGTINEVLNGFFAANGTLINQQAALSAISFATGGDLARLLPLGGEPQDIRNLCENPYPFTCDVIRADFIDWAEKPASRYFINVSDFGIGCETVIRVNRKSKALGGFISFLSSALGALFSAKNINMEIWADGHAFFQGEVSMAVIANGRFFGGGMYASPIAELDDGWMDLTVFHDFKLVQMLRCLPLVYSGNYLNHPQVIHTRAQSVSFKSQERFPFETDGELPGTSDVHYKIMPGAIQLLLNRPPA